MKTLIIILIILSFLQTTILPINFVLIVLICRTFIRNDKSNLYLAFGCGLLLSHLNLILIGSLSILYLILIFLAQVLSISRSINSIFLLLPFGIFALSTDRFIAYLLLNISFSFSISLFVSFFMIIPAFFLLKLWEERFIVRKDIKLKMK